jgi:lipopolysaccharide biosynthesis glycosyltransferase
MSVTVAYCFDRGYAGYAAISTYSLFANGNKNTQVYWVVPEEDQDAATKARYYFPDNLKTNITIIPAGISKFAHWKESYHFTRGMYLRLMLPLLLTEDKVIYIDADTIVQNNLTELYQIELGECLIGGVLDPAGKEESRIPRNAGDPYINSGVMLMDLKKLRLDDSFQKSVHIYERFHNEATWPDQCVINKYAEGKKFIINEKWNRQIFANSLTDSQFQKISNKNNSSILHFIGPIKPWQKWCNPCIANFWLTYVSRLNIKDVQIFDIGTIEQALIYTQALDLNRKFEESSFIKGNVIRDLINIIESQNIR